MDAVECDEESAYTTIQEFGPSYIATFNPNQRTNHNHVRILSFLPKGCSNFRAKVVNNGWGLKVSFDWPPSFYDPAVIESTFGTDELERNPYVRAAVLLSTNQLLDDYANQQELVAAEKKQARISTTTAATTTTAAVSSATQCREARFFNLPFACEYRKERVKIVHGVLSTNEYCFVRVLLQAAPDEEDEEAQA